MSVLKQIRSVKYAIVVMPGLLLKPPPPAKFFVYCAWDDSGRSSFCLSLSQTDSRVTIRDLRTAVEDKTQCHVEIELLRGKSPNGKEIVETLDEECDFRYTDESGRCYSGSEALDLAYAVLQDSDPPLFVPGDYRTFIQVSRRRSR